MKKFLVWVLVMLFTMGIAACAEIKDPVDEAKEVVENYMEQLYNIDDFTILKGITVEKEMEMVAILQEKLKPYMTSKMEQLASANREFSSIFPTARKRQINIDFDGIEFESVKYEGSDISLTYEAKIILTNRYGKAEEKNKRGYIKLVKVENAWKIDNHRAMNFPFELLGEDQYTIETKNIQDMIQHTTEDRSYSQLENCVGGITFTVHNNTSERITLKFPNSKIYELILYREGKEIWRYGNEIHRFDDSAVIKVIDKGSSLVFSLDYPITVPAGEYEFEFYLNAEGWENKVHLRDKILIDKIN